MSKSIEVQLQEANDKIALLEAEKSTITNERDEYAALANALEKKLEEISVNADGSKVLRDDVFVHENDTYQVLTPVISLKKDGKMQPFTKADIIADAELQAFLVTGNSSAIKKV